MGFTGSICCDFKCTYSLIAPFETCFATCLLFVGDFFRQTVTMRTQWRGISVDRQLESFRSSFSSLSHFQLRQIFGESCEKSCKRGTLKISSFLIHYHTRQLYSTFGISYAISFLCDKASMGFPHCLSYEAYPGFYWETTFCCMIHIMIKNASAVAVPLCRLHRVFNLLLVDVRVFLPDGFCHQFCPCGESRPASPA